MKLAAIVITNKTSLDPLLLQSLSFADEIIIIVDSKIQSVKSKEKKVKHFFHPLNYDFAAQRNFALSQTNADWVLFVDDDEYVGSELQLEIKDAIKNPEFSGYSVKRQDVVFHQPLLRGETGNIKILRLGRRTEGKFERPVHEIWKIQGRVGELGGILYHKKNHFISEFVGRMSHYGEIDSKILNLENKPFSWFRLLVYSLAKFNLNYYFKLGFLDGYAGLFLSYLMAVQSLTVRIFQWENQN